MKKNTLLMAKVHEKTLKTAKHICFLEIPSYIKGSVIERA